MAIIAKLFQTGSSQAVRLPEAFRLPGNEVWISKNEATGVITLTPKPAPDRLNELFRLIDEGAVPESYVAERDNPVESPGNPFARQVE